MYVIQTVPQAIGLMLVGILLLGTWPAVWHQVDRSGRPHSHTFLDYALTYLVFAPTCALTLGQLGPAAVSPGGVSLQFLDQLQQDNWQMVLFALAGGTCLALGDIALQHSIPLCGLSVGPPILNSITLLVGVLLAYFLDGGINKPQLVFTGAGCAALAVGLGAAAHVARHSNAAAAAAAAAADMTADNAQHPEEQRELQLNDTAHGGRRQQKVCLCSTSDKRHADNRSHDETAAVSSSPDAVAHNEDSAHLASNSKAAQQTTVLLPLSPAPGPQASAARHVHKSPLYLGLAVSVAGGVIYGCFLPAFQVAANDPFKMLPTSTPALSVYTTYFYFAVGFAAVSIAVNAWLLYKPPQGLPRSSLSAYLRDNTGWGRGLSVLSGVLAAAGDLTQFMGGQTAGYAAAMMVMAYPVVGVLWALLCFKELRPTKSGQQTGRPWGLVLVCAQVVLYVLSVGLLSGSAELRSHSA